MDIASTARLRLRTAQPGDGAFYLALLNDPGFIEHIGDRGVRTLDEAEQSLRDGPIAMQAECGHSLYVVELHADGTPIGMCGLIKRAALDGVDIGYAYLAAHCGCGYAEEAGRAVLGYAATLGLTRVLAITSPENTASNGLLLKLGLRLEGIVMLAPEDAGTNLYGIDIGRPG